MRIDAAVLTGVSRPERASAVPKARAPAEAPSAAAMRSPAPRRPLWIGVSAWPPDMAPASPSVSMVPPRALVPPMIREAVPRPGTFNWAVIGRPAASPRATPVVPLAIASCTAWPIWGDPVTLVAKAPAPVSGARPNAVMRSPPRCSAAPALGMRGAAR